MRKMFALASIAALAIGTSAMAGSEDIRIVSGTVDQSEWAKPGQLSVNLATGEYSFKPGATTREDRRSQLRREPLNGIVAPAALGELNAIVAQVEKVGLVDTQCAATDPSERTEIIISNGGKHEVIVKLAGNSLTSHPDLECWTQPAKALHAALQKVIDTERSK